MCSIRNIESYYVTFPILYKGKRKSSYIIHLVNVITMKQIGDSVYTNISPEEPINAIRFGRYSSQLCVRVTWKDSCFNRSREYPL